MKLNKLVVGVVIAAASHAVAQPAPSAPSPQPAPPAPSPQSAPPAPSPLAAAANDYRLPANWLCLPGRADACRTDQSATAVAVNGATTAVPWQAATAPKVDCFYVYPTVSFDTTANSDMVPGPEEASVVNQQLNRFAAQCRMFAPMYRQVTITALRSVMTGAPMAGIDRDLPYRDVRDAWRNYLADHNGGRGVVLIGHSQGSGVLKRLLAEEIDDKPVQKQLVAAILAGTNVLVPAGQVMGGDLKSIPLCTAAGQRGCVISFVSFRAEAPPPANIAAARRMDLAPLIRLGRTEEAMGGRNRDSIIADAVEALVAAIYRESGYETAREFLLGILAPEIAGVNRNRDWRDPKTVLQELRQADHLSSPVYQVTSEHGRPHDKVFTVDVLLDDKVAGTGSGKTKKEAQRTAAEAALGTHPVAVAPTLPKREG